MKHQLYAQKDLVIGDKQILAGDVLLTVETEIPLDRALNAVTIGSASPNKPEVRVAEVPAVPAAVKSAKQPK